MTRSQLVELVREVLNELDEANTTNVGGASFTAGAGANMLLQLLLVDLDQIELSRH